MAAVHQEASTWRPHFHSLLPRQPTLPASGSDQLDKYLKYLLTEGTHIKFLYYRDWGVSEEGCVALAEFMRHDRRMRIMTLSGNHISDEGACYTLPGTCSNSSFTCLHLCRTIAAAVWRRQHVAILNTVVQCTCTQVLSCSPMACAPIISWLRWISAITRFVLAAVDAERFAVCCGKRVSTEVH